MIPVLGGPEEGIVSWMDETGVLDEAADCSPAVNAFLPPAVGGIAPGAERALGWLFIAVEVLLVFLATKWPGGLGVSARA